MINFDTFYSKQETNQKYNCNSGSDYENVYGYEVDKKTGVRSLVIQKKTNIKEYIQSFKDSVDINKMMERFKQGELDVFDRVNGIYADVTDFPTTYAELFDRVEHCKSVFNELPTDVKEKFNNSYSEFWAQFGTPAFNEKLFPAADVVVDNPAASVEERSDVNE